MSDKYQPKNVGLYPTSIDGINAVAIGTITWLIALVVLLLSKNWLDANSRTHWIYIASSGVVLGLLGYRYTTNRVKRLGQSRDDFIFKRLNKQNSNQCSLIQDFE